MGRAWDDPYLRAVALWGRDVHLEVQAAVAVVALVRERAHQRQQQDGVAVVVVFAVYHCKINSNFFN